MERTDLQTASSLDGETITYSCWSDGTGPKATLQIVHGMEEHVLRYAPLAEYLVENGVKVYGHDQLGHGRSIGKNGPGFIAESNGDERLIDDVGIIASIIEKNNPSIPHFILGHSMGSFVVRRYMTRKDQSINGYIVMGTGNTSGFVAGLGRRIADKGCRKQGPGSFSDTLDKMVLGGYDKKFDGDVKNRWLSTDMGSVEAYNSDPLCGFRFTNSAYRDLMTMLVDLAKKKDFERIDTSVPVLFQSGAEDPLNRGKAVDKVASALASYGIPTKVKLYEGCRHEILNDSLREEVQKDILGFISDNL